MFATYLLFLQLDYADLVLRKHHCKLCVSVSLTGVLFRFEQPVYNILESGVFQEVCVMLVMGILDRQVVVTVQTGTTGTATGRNQFFA